ASISGLISGTPCYWSQHRIPMFACLTSPSPSVPRARNVDVRPCKAHPWPEISLLKSSQVTNPVIYRSIEIGYVPFGSGKPSKVICNTPQSPPRARLAPVPHVFVTVNSFQLPKICVLQNLPSIE